MAAFLAIASIICGCFVIISGQSVVDETDISGQCIWNIGEYMRQSFERTCRPTQQLLVQMKRSFDSISAKLKILDDRQGLVSALTSKFATLPWYVYRQWWRLCYENATYGIINNRPKSHSAKRQALSTLATIVAENEVAVFSRRFRRLVAEIIDY